MEDDTDLLAIAVLIDELRHDVLANRLNSMQKLDHIAKALGPQRTRDELLPYLCDFVDDEDEILLALCDNMPILFDFVGGATFAHTLLKPLEGLATVEDATVRDKALDSIRALIARLPGTSVDNFAVPMVHRMATGDWFTHRLASASLFACVHTCSPSDSTKAELRALYPLLCRDETPMVRRAACSHIGQFAAALDHEQVLQHVVPSLASLAGDEQDSVRLLAVENCIAVAATLTSEDERNELLAPLAIALAHDASWRVRYMVATHIVALCEALGESRTQGDLLLAFVLLLRDVEAEVRTAAASQVARVSVLCGASLTLEQLVPAIRELAVDASQFVRASLASVILGLASVLTRAAVISDLLPMFLLLLRDAQPEVRLNVIARLDVLQAVIGVDMLAESLLPAIADLAADKKWRIRLAIIEHVPSLAQQLGVQFFDEHLASMCISWLGDSVHAIREAASSNLPKIAEVFGVEWAINNLVPRIASVASNPNYLYRITAIYCVRDLCALFGPSASAQHLLPLALTLAGDAVPNIRFNVAKLFAAIAAPTQTIAWSPEVLKLSVKPALVKLTEDNDVDVRFFAAQALALPVFA